jgi:hypothetical protein
MKPNIGNDDEPGLVIALVTPLLLFHAIPVEFGLNALKILNPDFNISDSSSLVTSSELISTMPRLLMGDIKPGVTGRPFNSMTWVLPLIVKLLPILAIIFPEIRMS